MRPVAGLLVVTALLWGCSEKPASRGDPFAATVAPAGFEPEKTAGVIETRSPSPVATPAQRPAVMVAAGDIASCAWTRDEATADLAVAQAPDVVAVLGDVVYPTATTGELEDCYDPNWGRLKALSRPAVGNHEYGVPGASDYFNYFGEAAGGHGDGYYSYRAGTWHVVVLNSNCWAVGGCGPGSTQYRWLQEDLAGVGARCVLAYWHHPVFSSGSHGGLDWMEAAWDLLQSHGADVVLTGHEHHYERFARQDARGVADAGGLRQFIVGTGGGAFYDVGKPVPNSEVAIEGRAGVLRLELGEGEYEWRFVLVDGEVADEGRAQC